MKSKILLLFFETVCFLAVIHLAGCRLTDTESKPKPKMERTGVPVPKSEIIKDKPSMPEDNRNGRLEKIIVAQKGFVPFRSRWNMPFMITGTNGEIVAEIIIRNVLVIDVDLCNVTVQLTPEQAECLDLARKLGGALILDREHGG